MKLGTVLQDRNDTPFFRPYRSSVFEGNTSFRRASYI